MAPHTITSAVGVSLPRCKAKAGLRCSPRAQSPRARHHSKQRRRWVGVKGSTLNGRRHLKCPSARRLRMVREDTRSLVKMQPVPGWRSMQQLAVHAHLLRCGGLLDDWSVEGVPSLVFV
ncbi:uncharacterized protein TNCV_4457041 [Trichonephila clavipes]|nr:uncharacterized protein TNCV_4457041 [Trichonephila clavipes]